MNGQIQARKRWRIGCLSALFLIIATPIIAWKVFEYRFRLWLIPEDLNVWWIGYARQESWGFGPGGNETGVIVYSLPQESIRQTFERGVI
ncbi:hypothetical protein ABMA32_17270 [Mesorhizobium sp. VNQ89]|uniref:hypothetical protein n=1 Tax=Mesorhizobium quangtriensis TaxID=3157709 RepID=UPI0032B863F2